MSTSLRVAHNIIRKYGKEGLKELLDLFVSNVSYTIIAEKYGVTRQRVHQWGTSLGTRTVTYTLDQNVTNLLK